MNKEKGGELRAAAWSVLFVCLLVNIVTKGKYERSVNCQKI